MYKQPKPPHFRNRQHNGECEYIKPLRCETPVIIIGAYLIEQFVVEKVFSVIDSFLADRGDFKSFFWLTAGNNNQPCRVPT